jgi:DnaJ-domain-containing protein 1
VSAAVLISPTGEATVAFDFSYSAVEELKSRIPVHARSWNPERKVWTISAGPFVPVAIAILEDIFGTDAVHVHDDRTGRHRPDGAPPLDAYATLHLQPTAPPELVTAAYKCLAKLAHPDRGGTTTNMQMLNAAFDSLRDQLSASRVRNNAT